MCVQHVYMHMLYVAITHDIAVDSTLANCAQTLNSKGLMWYLNITQVFVMKLCGFDWLHVFNYVCSYVLL